MQTTRRAQRFQLAAAVAAFALALSCACAAVGLVAPSPAYAKSYEMPQVTMKATIQSDGTLHVTERRIFDFTGTFSAVWWEQGLPEYGEYRVNSVHTGFADQLDTSNPIKLTAVGEVPFDYSWRTAGGPGVTAYSVDTEESTCYLFFNATDTYMIAEIDYEVTHAVQVYADCAELYWKYIQPGWSEDSRNVTCTIQLPVPEGAEAVPTQNVYAWGHGDRDGQLEFINGNTQVQYKNSRVVAGDWAEARVEFPKEWMALQLDTLPAEERSYFEAQATETHLQEVLAEEQKWADETNRKRILTRAGLLAVLLASLAPIAWALWRFSRVGFERKPTTYHDYWRDDPDKGVHPAVIMRLCNWNKKDSDQLTVTLMHLANEGAFSINKSSQTVEGFFGSKTQDSYYLVRNPNYTPTNALDQATLTLIFETVGKGNSTVWLNDIKAYAETSPTACEKTFENWHSKLDSLVSDQEYFELAGENTKSAIYGVAIALAGIAFGGLSLGLWPLLVLIIPAVVLLFIGHFAPRRSQKGADTYERCQALKRWLTDFSSLNERPAADVKVWGHFMVYALAFGVAAKALAELRKVAPEIFAAESSKAAANSSYVPFYHYYMGEGSSAGSIADAFSSVSSTVSSAAAPSADGGGGGGGFSVGGGGGFGGGGGGAR